MAGYSGKQARHPPEGGGGGGNKKNLGVTKVLWSIADSNRLPQHCQCCALPDELIPRFVCKFSTKNGICKIFRRFLTHFAEFSPHFYTFHQNLVKTHSQRFSPISPKSVRKFVRKKGDLLPGCGEGEAHKFDFRGAGFEDGEFVSVDFEHFAGFGNLLEVEKEVSGKCLILFAFGDVDVIVFA